MSYSWVTPQQDLQITTICHMMQMAAGTGQQDTVDYLIHHGVVMTTSYYYSVNDQSDLQTKTLFQNIMFF